MNYDILDMNYNVKFKLHICVGKVLCHVIIHIECVCPCIEIVYLVVETVKNYWCIFFAAFAQGQFFHPGFCLLMKPGVYCQAKRQ